ncbi:MAG: hypothetical protein NTW86_23440, partial [Candidatus Sumerlaeota bacterium]|nr:hypothetical protein [Candidatus Sumerlaeota bacterium]
MRFPKHWAKASQSGQDLKGKTLNCEAWGWSFESWDEARQNALDRAMRAFEAFRAGRKPDRYAYGDRPVREEVVKT